MADLEGKCFVRMGNALVPADIAADEYLSTIPQKREVIVEVRRPRSPIFHRWFFALLRLVIDATGKREVWPTEENLLDALKHAVGHTETYVTIDGEIETRPKSIAFASMDEDTFIRFVRRVTWVIFDHFGIDVEELMGEVDREQRLALAGKMKLAKRETSDVLMIEDGQK